ncbi:hypothetical protein NESM_000560300 [Novymonas esmeraldas]|uniref:Uncharacterized protein n=1 Tax=Novymonas esmeraldas TaxID=1808958 RepID=A0AAW0EQ71_9TRYP
MYAHRVGGGGGGGAAPVPVEDVFVRLSRRGPTTLSPPAFAAAAAKLQDEASQCTFQPSVNHVYDSVLLPWAAGADVFTRLAGHARCQQQQRQEAQRARRQADAADAEEWRARFRRITFPVRLYSSAPALISCAPPSPPGTRIRSVLRCRTDRASGSPVCVAPHPQRQADETAPPAAHVRRPASPTALAEMWLTRMADARRSRLAAPSEA